MDMHTPGRLDLVGWSLFNTHRQKCSRGLAVHGRDLCDRSSPSSAQIVTEWAMTDPASDSARWREGISRYEAGSLDDNIAMETAAELMCAALTYYVADGTIICDLQGEPPDTAVAQTIWNVLVATLYSGAGTALTESSAKCLRLTLAAARQGGYQPEDLGGNDLMAELFEDASRARMSAALSGSPAHAGRAPVHLARWFTGQAGPKPMLAKRAGRTQPNTSPPRQGETSADPGGEPCGNELSRPGIMSIRSPCSMGSRRFKGRSPSHRSPKWTGRRLKIRKVGLAKAAMRPSKTLRRALDGAALAEHLKAYNHQAYGMGGSPPDSD